jgi:hypothetical protein
MNRILKCLLCCSIAFFTPKVASAQEANAQEAAQYILGQLAQPQYDLLWDQKVSDYAKSHMSKDAFVSRMAIARPQLGKLISFSTVSREHTMRDQLTGFEGDMYAITFRSKYEVGEFYERIVVVKDQDGQYRLANLLVSRVS